MRAFTRHEKPDDHSHAHHVVTYAMHGELVPLETAQAARGEYETALGFLSLWLGHAREDMCGACREDGTCPLKDWTAVLLDRTPKAY